MKDTVDANVESVKLMTLRRLCPEMIIQVYLIQLDIYQNIRKSHATN